MSSAIPPPFDPAPRVAPGLWRELVVHAPTPMAILDRELRYLAASASWSALLGIQQVVGRSHLEIFPELPPSMQALYQRCLAGATEAVAEVSYTLPDGREVWTSGRCRPWRDASGVVGGLVLQAEFLDQRRLARAAQERAERELDRVRLLGLESRINEIELVLRPDGTILHANDRALEAHGYAREELEGLDVRHLRQADPPALVGRQLADAAATGVRFEAVHVRRDGTSFPVEVSSRTFTVHGQPYLHSLVRDLTEQRRAQQALETSLAEKEQALAELKRALDHVQALRELLPICMFCHRIRDDAGYWSQLEAYLAAHAEVRFSHGLCPECERTHFPDDPAASGG